LSGFALSRLDRIEHWESIVNNAIRMIFRRTAALLLVATALAVAGCGSKAGAHERHAQAAQAPEAAPPTPDTTPFEVLRTPAGLVLKIGETPRAVTPTPTASPAAGKPSA
jgi:hypothetical protein